MHPNPQISIDQGVLGDTKDFELFLPNKMNEI